MDEIKKWAAHALNRVLETMFFETAEPVGEAEDHEFQYVGTVVFEGDAEGALGLKLNRGLATLLARNLYGEEEDEQFPDKLIWDVIRELTNMVGGSFLEMAEPKLGRLSFGIPAVAEITDGQNEHNGLPERFGLTFEIDGDLMALQVFGLKGVDS